LTPAAGYDPKHFAATFAVEDRHFWFGARNLALEAIIETLTPRLPDQYRVLEVGCGTGNTLRMLTHACPRATLIVGMDLLEEGLQYARRRTGIPVVRGRIEQPPFTVPFDLVAMFDVLEHIADDAACLRQVRGLMRQGSYFVATVPARKRLWSRFDEEAHHCRRYEVDELRERLTAAGLTVEYLTPFMTVLYPLATAARWILRSTNRARQRLEIPQKSAVATDLTIRPGLNELMALVLKPEAALIRRRRRLPFGTSLLAVARFA
jgi:SAM-dependent methyltransferase